MEDCKTEWKTGNGTICHLELTLKIKENTKKWLINIPAIPLLVLSRVGKLVMVSEFRKLPILVLLYLV